MTDAKLKSYADRIDRLEEEKKAIGGDVRDVYGEVKGAGYNIKALRKVLAERRRKTDEQLDAEVETYRAALGVPGATLRSVAAKLGVTKSKLQRLVPKHQNGTPHDPETGEIKVPAASRSDASDEGDSERRPDPVGCDGAGTIILDEASEVTPAMFEEPPPLVEDGAVAEPQAERVAPEIIDDLKIPHFLLRVPA